MLSQHLKTSLERSNHVVKSILCIAALTIISGCSFNGGFNKNNNLGQYYLWLKGLTHDELINEIDYQSSRLSTTPDDAKLHLLLLASLPKSPNHNPYNAKETLNESDFNQFVHSNLHPEDFALINVLRDQLNQQLLQLNEIDSNQQLSDQQVNKLKLKITMQQQIIKELTEKLAQLKDIEKNLNKRDQI